MKQNWQVRSYNLDEILLNQDLFRIPRHVSHIINARGYRTKSEIHIYLNAPIHRLYSPYSMQGMHDAVSRLKKSLATGENIGIFADSDLDGITSLAVLYTLLEKFKKPHIRYTHGEETYGLTMEIIDEFNDNNVNLIITVDSGIKDREQIEYARSLGIDVIITDHHEQDDCLPDAIIINPKLDECGYPFKQLSGVGVAFKLTHAFLMSFLPVHDKVITLIIKEKESFHLLQILNGIILQKKTIDDPQTLIELVKNYSGNGFIVHHGFKKDNDFNDVFINCTSYSFDDFSRMLTGDRLSNIEKVIKKYNIDDMVFSGIDLFLEILLTLAFEGSPKIKNFIESVIGFVALGSIADIVPLIDENRILVKNGILALNKKKLYPSLALLAGEDEINSKKIAWEISPFLNAPGRIGKTEWAVNFFLEHNNTRMKDIISQIDKMNFDRKETISRLCSEILINIETGSIASSEKIIHVHLTDTPDGFTGLIANRISEQTGKPVIVTTVIGDGTMVKGSGRVSYEFDFLSYIVPHFDYFERVGGHSQAFGFTIKLKQLDEIILRINNSMNETVIPEKDIQIDMEIDLKAINLEFINSLRLLEPFGSDNEEPVFLSKNIDITSFSTLKSGKHGKYLFENKNSISGIGWNMGCKMEEIYFKKKPINIVYRLEMNFYRGIKMAQMIILDIELQD
jgi:single-stranded-DNA-specific exonuclease